jgi:hypothetical protein
MADTIDVTAGAVTVSGSWGQWKIDIADVKIGGLTVPSFGSSWVALQLASGILAGVGSVIFDVLSRALGLGGPSFQQLLEAFVSQVGSVVRQEIRNNEIRKYLGRLDAIQRNMLEYRNAPTSIDRLQLATTESQYLLSELQTYGYWAYNLVLCAGALRLAILRERAKQDPAEVTNYNALAGYLSSFHDKIHAEISLATSPPAPIQGSARLSIPCSTVMSDAYFFARDCPSIPRQTLTQPILDVPLASVPTVAPDSNDASDELIRRYNEFVVQYKPPFVKPYLGRVGERFNPTVWGPLRNGLDAELRHELPAITRELVAWQTLKETIHARSTGPGSQFISRILQSRAIQ